MRQRPPPQPSLGPFELEGQGDDASQGTRSLPPQTGLAYFTGMLFSLIILGAAAYGLYECRLVPILLTSRRINRLALNIGLLSSTVMVALWGYLDVYRASYQKKRVAYETARSTTHAIIACMLITLICMGVALWPIYRAATPVVLLALYYGILFQLIVLFPVRYSNPIIFLMYALFVYHYTQGTTPW